MRLAIRLLVLLAVVAAIANAQRPPVSGGTDSGQSLRAPAEQDNFSIVIFGDRTGGNKAGLRVLADGVRMANHLAPDFVMTVGDLVQGYNGRKKWLFQMRRFKSYVKKLRMPWYPVAGNHDVYGTSRKDNRIPEYKQHFGPLYYSFDYKFAHLVCLFSDEQLSFRRPKFQNMSAEQMQWLRDDLANTKAKIVFVFLHHPRWTKYYKGCNWPEVHDILKRDGRVKAVFSGHLHRYRDDGLKDGIHYYTLAATGGYLSGLDEVSFYHINHVRIWRDRIESAVIPTGSIRGSDTVLGREDDEIQFLVGSQWIDAVGDVRVSPQGSRRSHVEITLHNPSEAKLPVEASFELPDGWRANPAKFEAVLAPGTKRNFTTTIDAARFTGTELTAKITGALHYGLKSGRTQRIRRSHRFPLQLEGVTAALAKPKDGANRVLRLDGKSAIRVDLPALKQAFTLECWVRGKQPDGRVGLIARTENCNFSLFWTPDPHGSVYVEKPGKGGKPGYLALHAKQPWDYSKWTHLAICYDGERARYFVDGKLQSSAAGRSPRFNDRYPLYIGADPGRRGEAGSFFRGAIDEVRLSTTSRYMHDFEPARRFKPDTATLALYHFDGSLRGLAIDASGNDHHGWPVGHPKRAKEALPSPRR